MDTYSLAHTRWKCQYHIVFIPKYRQKRLYGRLREDVREIIKKLCEYKKVEMIWRLMLFLHLHISLNIKRPDVVRIVERRVGYCCNYII